LIAYQPALADRSVAACQQIVRPNAIPAERSCASIMGDRLELQINGLQAHVSRMFDFCLRAAGGAID
jgi:hypothetical protein